MVRRWSCSTWTPPRPTAEVVNGAAELNPGFSITENKQHACVFRLVFQYVHSASGEVVRTHRRRISARSKFSSETACRPRSRECFEPQWSIRLLEDHSLLR